MTDNQPKHDANAEYELTTFFKPDGAIIHKKTGLGIALSLQMRSQSPDALFYLPTQVDYLMQSLQELVESGEYSINFDALSKDFRNQLSSQGLPPLDAFNDLPDNNLPPSQMAKPNAQPRGNANPPATQSSHDENDGKFYEITGVEMVQSSKGTIGYKFYRSYKDENGALKQVQIMPGNKAEYRSGTAEIVLKALGFSAETIGSMEVGDKKQVKTRGVKVECSQEPSPNNPAHTVTQIINYHLPDGKVIKA